MQSGWSRVQLYVRMWERRGELQFLNPANWQLVKRKCVAGADW